MSTLAGAWASSSFPATSSEGIMALTESTPETIKASLKITGRGVVQNLELTYKNRDEEEIEEFTRNEQNFKLPESIKDNSLDAFRWGNAQMVLFLVESFDDGTDKTYPLTVDGLLKMEKKWKGVLRGIVTGFHQAQQVEVEKN
jgi:hypothetical protein